MEQIIQEVAYSKLKNTSITKTQIQIDKPSIILVIPDTNVDLVGFLPNLNLYLSQCLGIISPNTTMTIGNKMFNGKQQNTKLKTQLTKQNSIKKLKIINVMRNIDINKNEYLIYDMTLFSNSYEFITSKSNMNQSTPMIFNELSKIYDKIKLKNEDINIILMFCIKDSNGLFSDMFHNIKTYLSKDVFLKLNLYTTYGFVHTPNSLVPVFGKENNNNILLTNNIKKLPSLLLNTDESKISQIDKKENTLNKNLLISINDTDDSVVVNVNTKVLSGILKKYNITNPDIIANAKNSIKDYIELNSIKSMSEYDASEIVFKSIHQTLFNTDVVDPDYLANPEKLLNKISDVNNYTTPLVFSESVTNNIINPKSVIDIDYTTGAWRQKYEFEETIHENIKKLFSTFEETPDHAVKVKKIKHSIIDNNADRLIQYTITLQNTSGDNTDEYDITLNIPGIVNDRYVKLNGSQYIMANQQFMKPITKTEKNKVRILSNYAIIHLSLENTKFDLSKTEEILSYIGLKYPGLIKERTEEYFVFKDNSKIYFVGDIVYTDSVGDNITFDKETNCIYNNDNDKLLQTRNEIIYEKIIEQIQIINPDDKLGKTKQSIQYIAIYIGGLKLPLITYMWQQKGLLSALNEFGLDYEIIDKNADVESKYLINIKNNKLLSITPTTARQEFICNGLLAFKIKKKINNLDDPTEIHALIDKQHGQSATRNLKLLNDYEIDPVTKELLEFENLPVNLSNLLSNQCLDKLLNDPVQDIADLNIYRSRLSEMMLNIMYKQVTMAHNEYRKKISLGIKDAKINIISDHIIKNIYSQPGVLQYTSGPNPIEGITLASQVIKTGPGGVPNKESFTTNHRAIHKSHIGNISANTTPESGNVGLTTSHTLTPSIINEFGSYSTNDPKHMSGWEAVALNEALIPFANEVDSDRLVMGATHVKQTTPSVGNQPPLVGTGAEFITTELSSKRFVQKSKQDGVVINVDPNKTMTIKYKDNTEETFDIIPRLSKTYMGAFIGLDMDTIKEGEKVKKGQMIAWTLNFNKNGMYCSGRNCTMAIMQYMGTVYEDAYCIADTMAEDLHRDIIKQVQIVIPPETKILKLVTDKKDITPQDVLVEFTYNDNLDEYLNTYDIMGFDEDSDDEYTINYKQGNNSIKLMGHEGKIVDVKVFINNKTKVDSQIINFHKDLAVDTKNTITKLEKSYKNKDDKIKALDNISTKFLKIGGHKLKGGMEFTGAEIVYYIKQKENLKLGDKLASRYGAKGVISYIIPTPDIPYSKSELPIDVFISTVGMFGRKNIAMLKELYLGKVIFILNKKIKEMAKLTTVQTERIINLIIDVYQALKTKELIASINQYLDKMGQVKFRKQLIDDPDFMLNVLVPPFKTINFEDIKEAANILKIELDEYVYIPKLKTWTKQKVPVGVCYMQSLEQTSKSYVTARSTGKYNMLTSQSVKGKSRGGGQAVGNLDLHAFLTFDAGDIVDELYTLRADDHNAKREVINNITTTGQSNMPKNIKQGTTSTVLKTFMNSMGLHY